MDHSQEVKETPKSSQTPDYAGTGDRVPVPRAGQAVAGFVFGAAAIFFSLFLRASLHNQLNSTAILLWLAVAVAATRFVLLAWKCGGWLDERRTAQWAAIGLVGLGWLGGVLVICFP